MLIIRGSGPGKTNALLNLIKHQRPDIDELYLYIKVLNMFIEFSQKNWWSLWKFTNLWIWYEYGIYKYGKTRVTSKSLKTRI